MSAFIFFSSILICIGLTLTFEPACPSYMEYLTIHELSDYCKQSGTCGERLCCEGKEVRVKGYLDFINIAYNRLYPNVLIPKFRVFDGPHITDTDNPWSAYTDSLEVYPTAGNREALFEKLIEGRGLPLKIIYMKGIIRGFDAHTNAGRYRMFDLTVNAEDVFSAD